MIIRFDKKTKKLIKKTSKRVAKRLGVEKATLCIVTDAQAHESKDVIGVCFETPVDDTYADLEIPIHNWFDITEILENFMGNPNVEWSHG